MYDPNQVKKLHQSTEKLARRKSCWYGFLYGIALGLGATVGVSVITGIILFALQKLQLLPFINTEQIQELIELLRQNTSYLRK